MKITNEKLKQIIKEELENSINEVRNFSQLAVVNKIIEKISGKDKFLLRQMIENEPDEYIEVYQAILKVLEATLILSEASLVMVTSTSVLKCQPSD